MTKLKRENVKTPAVMRCDDSPMPKTLPSFVPQKREQEVFFGTYKRAAAHSQEL